MIRSLKFLAIVFFVTVFVQVKVFGQDKKLSPEEEYTKVITQRSDKIVDAMDFSNETTKLNIRDLIVDFYRDLSTIQDKRDADIEELKKSSDNKEEIDSKIESLKSDADKKISIVHDKFVADLSKFISEEQISQVKDGLTYNVAPNTYKTYKEMIPGLTEEQKAKIWEWLVEAREHAMVGGSSKEKHGWFGKYKGRINNYLSAEGYDLKKEEAAWQERIKAQKN